MPDGESEKKAIQPKEYPPQSVDSVGAIGSNEAIDSIPSDEFELDSPSVANSGGEVSQSELPKPKNPFTHLATRSSTRLPSTPKASATLTLPAATPPTLNQSSPSTQPPSAESSSTSSATPSPSILPPPTPSPFAQQANPSPGVFVIPDQLAVAKAKFAVVKPPSPSPSPSASTQHREPKPPAEAQKPPTEAQKPPTEPPKPPKPTEPAKQDNEFLAGLQNVTSTSIKVLFQTSDRLSTFQRTTSDRLKALFDTSDRLQRETSSRLQAIFSGAKPPSAEADDVQTDDIPESEWLTSDGQSDQAPPRSASDVWTMPESKLTQQERKIKKEYLTRGGPKSEPMRPNKALQAQSKPNWISTHRKKLLTSGLTISLIFFAWLFGHPFAAQQLVNRGIEQLSSGHPDDAITSFNTAIQVDGGSAGAYFNRGDAYKKKDEVKKAFDDYSTSLKLSPKSASTLESRAALSAQLENYELAVNDYTALFALAPEEAKPQMYDNRASAYAALAQYDKALQDYGLALKADSKDMKALIGSASCLLQLGHYASAASEYKLALLLDPHNSDAYLGRGYCYLKQKNFSGAAKDFQTVLDQDPLNKQALCYRADLNAAQGASAKALEDLATVLQLDPKYAPALVSRAVLYTNKGDYAGAVKDYDQAEKIPLFKGRLALCLDRASVYRKMKDYEKAAADYGAAIGLAPNDYRPYLSRAQCYQQLKDYRKAIADCDTAAKLSPKTADIYQQRGTMHEQFGNSMSAYKDYSTAISLDSKNIEPYISRGRSSLARKDFAAALADFDQALKIDSKNAAALALHKQAVDGAVPKLAVAPSEAPKPAVAASSNNLDFSKVTTANLIKNGYSRLQQGSALEAISMLSEAVRRDPNDSSARRYLAYAMLRAERRSEAIEQFEALRQLKALLPADERALQKAGKQSGDQQSGDSQHITPTLTLAQYQAKLVADPGDLNSIYCVAVLFAKSGMTPYAILECQDGMNRTPNKSEWHQRFEGFYNYLKGSKK